jgi:uncharacterized protein (TIGR02145 family)
MKTKNIIGIRPLITIVAISFLFTGCKKENDLVIAPITFNTSVTYGSLTDQDGNIYKTVTVGTQTWMAENLKTTKYRNGDPIQNVADSAQWRQLTTGAYCYYDNDERYGDAYGCLYNWYAVNDSRNLAPSGWHIPTDAEWAFLNNSLGGEDVAANKLKEAGTTHWGWGNNSTNESGFTALPGGSRVNYFLWGATVPTHYEYLGLYGFWWTPTEATSNYFYHHFIASEVSIRSESSKDSGMSVRCVKD